MCPGRYWHSVVEKVRCRTKVDSHGETNDGRSWREYTEAEERDDGYLDPEVDLDIPE